MLRYPLIWASIYSQSYIIIYLCEACDGNLKVEKGKYTFSSSFSLFDSEIRMQMHKLFKRVCARSLGAKAANREEEETKGVMKRSNERESEREKAAGGRTMAVADFCSARNV